MAPRSARPGFVASFHLPGFPLSSALDNEVVKEW